MSRPIARLTALLLFAAAGLAAQDEPGIQEQALEIRDRLHSIGRQLHERETELRRRIALLERLARGAEELGAAAPMTGRDAARRSVEEARAIAEQEPPLDRGVFQSLDRAEAALDRALPGDVGGTAAARFLGEVLAIEQSTTDAVRRFLFDTQSVRSLLDGIGRETEQELDRVAEALQRLFLVHAAALRARSAGEP